MKKLTQHMTVLLIVMSLTSCVSMYVPPKDGPIAYLEESTSVVTGYTTYSDPYKCSGLVAVPRNASFFSENAPKFVAIPANKLMTVMVGDVTDYACNSTVSFYPQANKHYAITNKSTDAYLSVTSAQIHHRCEAAIIDLDNKAPVNFTRRQTSLWDRSSTDDMAQRH
jgi:hypothetical protein